MILNEYLFAVELSCIRDENNKIMGFMGVADGKVEMLFANPKNRGEGIGKELMRHTVDDLDIRKVDVNEQNRQAVGFYEHLGFKTTSRS